MLNNLIHTTKSIFSEISPFLAMIFLQFQIDPTWTGIIVTAFISFVIGIFSIRKSIFETRKCKKESELIDSQIKQIEDEIQQRRRSNLS